MSKRIFIIDNYDSFTFNLVHLVEQLNVDFVVKRNDEFEVSELTSFSHLMISPGPGLPQEAGKTLLALEFALNNGLSVFGVCLGMQSILVQKGVKIENMPTVEHGAESGIKVSQPSLIFKGLPENIQVGRYHSWAFNPNEIPAEMKTTAISEDGYVMAIEAPHQKLFGVQFHPESIMTAYGLEMMRNWVEI